LHTEFEEIENKTVLAFIGEAENFFSRSHAAPRCMDGSGVDVSIRKGVGFPVTSQAPEHRIRTCCIAEILMVIMKAKVRKQ
jgi:hypothetical protein